MFYTDFCSDAEKMRDFFLLTKKEFLDSYSYLTEEEYNLTLEAVKTINLFNNRENNKEKENAKMEKTDIQKVGEMVRLAEEGVSHLESVNNFMCDVKAADIEKEVIAYITSKMNECGFTPLVYRGCGGLCICADFERKEARFTVRSGIHIYAAFIGKDGLIKTEGEGYLFGECADAVVNHWKDFKENLNKYIVSSLNARAAAAKERINEIKKRENAYKNWKV